MSYTHCYCTLENSLPRTIRNIQALVALTFIGAIIAIGALPASAASISPTVTATGLIGTTGLNEFPITVTATSATGAPANMFNVSLPQGWTFVAPAANCNGLTLGGFTAAVTCQKINFGSTGGFGTFQLSPSNPLTAGQTISVTFDRDTINVGSSRTFSVDLADSQSGGASVDSGDATLAGGSAPAPTPDAPSDNTTPAATDQLALTGSDAPLHAGSIALLLIGATLVSMTALRRRKV